MNILVIDDNAAHRSAAQEQLGKDHELTIASSYDEALKLIRADKEDPPTSRATFGGVEYRDRSVYYHCPFDAVLSDLMMPASATAQAGPGLAFVGQESPVGVWLALIAAQHGARFVGVLTDTNHHHHPAAESLVYARELMAINGARVLMTGRDPFLGAKEVDGDWISVKRWDLLLEFLTSDSPHPEHFARLVAARESS